MLTSYNANEQDHWTADLWEKHGGKCVYDGIPERLLDNFLMVFGTDKS